MLSRLQVLLIVRFAFLCHLVIHLGLCQRMLSHISSGKLFLSQAPVKSQVLFLAPSTAFHRNWSVSSVLNAACWKSNSVFASFYLKDLQFEFDGLCSLGPFVDAGVQIG